jgi:hypothetical protein
LEQRNEFNFDYTEDKSTDVQSSFDVPGGFKEDLNGNIWAQTDASTPWPQLLSTPVRSLHFDKKITNGTDDMSLTIYNGHYNTSEASNGDLVPSDPFKASNFTPTNRMYNTYDSPFKPDPETVRRRVPEEKFDSQVLASPLLHRSNNDSLLKGDYGYAQSLVQNSIESRLKAIEDSMLQANDTKHDTTRVGDPSNFHGLGIDPFGFTSNQPSNMWGSSGYVFGQEVS